MADLLLIIRTASYASVPGAIGLAAQIVFATFPIVQVWRR
jgi:hypothetical protein